MPLTAVGPAALVPAVKATATKLTQLLAGRLGPNLDVSVVFKTAERMPPRPDGGPSRGYWKAGLKEIWLWEKTDRYPVEKTLAHEAMHVLATFWLTEAQRNDIIELMKPRPLHWRDKTIGIVTYEYAASPFEVYAVYGSAAMVGFDKPAYRSLYRRHIDEGDWPKLRDIIVRTTDHDVRGEEPDLVESAPIPPDTIDEAAEELAEAQVQLTATLAANVELEIAGALAIGKLAQAKGKATDISRALGTGDILTAVEIAGEIEAL